MRTPRFARQFLVLAMAAMLLPMIGAGAASAKATTINADINACRLNVGSYSVMLQTGSERPVASDIPTSVTLHFADGSTAQADRWTINIGSAYYRLDDNAETYRELELVAATAEFDTAKYPAFRFTVTAYPCDTTPEPAPTSLVTGDVVQRGNEKPVADLTVCLVEADLCTTTDASGSFVIADVENGAYTLYTDGDNWKPQYNTVTVADGDVHVDVIQFKGGGKGN